MFPKWDTKTLNSAFKPVKKKKKDQNKWTNMSLKTTTKRENNQKDQKLQKHKQVYIKIRKNKQNETKMQINQSLTNLKGQNQ